MKEYTPEKLDEGIFAVRSGRKTIRMEILPDGSVMLRVPMQASRKALLRFVRDRSDWIRKHRELTLRQEQNPAGIRPLTPEEAQELDRRAKEIIPKRVGELASSAGISYGKVRVRMMRSRWGSCSRSGDLTFNSLLLLTPPEVLDSVILHELCHRDEMNHSPRFYALLSARCPDYPQCRLWLRKNSRAVLRRIPAGEDPK